MKLLLDTHTFLWAAFSPRKLSARARSALIDQENEVAVSSLSFWEVSLKFSLGKITLEGCRARVVRVLRSGSLAGPTTACSAMLRRRLTSW